MLENYKTDSYSYILMYNINIDSQDVKSFNDADGELHSLGTLESLGSREPSAIFSPYQER